MLLAPEKRVEDLIVSYLADHRSLSASRLHQLITEHHRIVSLQAVYKELRKLIVEGVVWKHESSYSLSASWVMNISELADKMYFTLTDSSLTEGLLPAAGEKLTFRFSNLRRLDDFWINSLVILAQASQEKKMYQWLPYPWFNLLQNYKSLPFQNALRISGAYLQSIIGDDSFLARQAESLTTKGVYEFSYAAGPFEQKQNTYYSVTDSHVQTVKIDSEKVEGIKSVYQSVNSFRDFKRAEIAEIIESPCKVTLTIESDTRVVRRVYNKLRNYFEV